MLKAIFVQMKGEILFYMVYTFDQNMLTVYWVLNN